LAGTRQENAGQRWSAPGKKGLTMQDIRSLAADVHPKAEPGAIFRSVTGLGDDVTGDPEFVAWADERMLDLIRAAYRKQGARAFESTLRATTLHEAGHAVIFRWASRDVSRIRVRRRRGQWVGLMEAPTTGSDFLQACFRIAGVMAELLFDREDFREGSSLNEIVLFNAACHNAALDTGANILDIQYRVMKLVSTILRRNERAVRGIACMLIARKTLRAKELTALLRDVDENSD
jgi:hypothetical protein